MLIVHIFLLLLVVVLFLYLVLIMGKFVSDIDGGRKG